MNSIVHQFVYQVVHDLGDQQVTLAIFTKESLAKDFIEKTIEMGITEANYISVDKTTLFSKKIDYKLIYSKQMNIFDGKLYHESSNYYIDDENYLPKDEEIAIKIYGDGTKRPFINKYCRFYGENIEEVKEKALRAREKFLEGVGGVKNLRLPSETGWVIFVKNIKNSIK